MAGSFLQSPMSDSLITNIQKFKPLADPDAIVRNKTELEFQMIIGNDMANAVYEGVVYKYTNQFVIKSTIFGNLFSGPIPYFSNSRKSVFSIFTVTGNITKQCTTVLSTVTSSKTELEKEFSYIVRNFYEQELNGLLQGDQTQDQADELVLENFQRNLNRKPDGRYVIKLPWKDDSLLPSENMQMAISRLRGQQRRLEKDPKLATQYAECFAEWEKMGVIEPSNWEEYNAQKLETVMLHHGVFREDHQTTKCRVVFDGSAVQEKSKYHKNACLETGKNLIPRMDAILLRIRFGTFIAVGDLAKVFLQQELCEDTKKLFVLLSDKQHNDNK
jgi:hypothetical protein